MKQVKKMGVLLMAAFVTVAIAGCSAGSSPSSTPAQQATASASAPNAPSGQSKLTIFQSKVEIADALKAVAKKYTEETGNEVEVWDSAGDDYATQLQAKLLSGQGPALFSVTTGSEAETFKSFFYDLSSEPYVKNISPNMALTMDGKVVGVPYGVEGFGLVYNKSLVDPKDVTDLNSFTKTLEKLKADGKSGLSLSQEGYFLIGHIINTPFALQPDPQGFIQKLNKGEVTMAATKEFQEFAKFMEVIRANTTNPLEINYDKQMGDFAAGKTAMVHQGNWSYGMLKDNQLGFEVGMLPFPLAGNNKIAVGVASNWAINAKAKPAEIQAAGAFLNWLLTSPSGQKAIVNDFKFIPAMTNVEANDLDPLSKAVFEAAKSGQTIPWANSYFPNGMILNDLVPVTQEFFLKKEMTGQQFLEKLDAVWAQKAPK